MTEIWAFIISKASVITCLVLHFVLFDAATDKVLLRLPNVIHDSSQFAVADKLCQTLTVWHICEVKLHTGFLLS